MKEKEENERKEEREDIKSGWRSYEYDETLNSQTSVDSSDANNNAINDDGNSEEENEKG